MPQAEKEFQEALRLRPDCPASSRTRQVYANSAQWLKSGRRVSRGGQTATGNAEAAYRLGSALLPRRKVPRARQELERADA